MAGDSLTGRSGVQLTGRGEAATPPTRTAASVDAMASAIPTKNEHLKLALVLAVCVALYFCARAIGDALAATREAITRVNIGILIPCFAIVMILRRIIAPIWYLVPSGALMVVVLVIKLGLVRGVVSFQSMKLLDLFSCAVIQKLYGPCLGSSPEVARPLTDAEGTVERRVKDVAGRAAGEAAKATQGEEEGGGGVASQWLPGVLMAAIAALDEEWAHRVVALVPLQRSALVVAFGVSWYMEEEAMLYWFATRSQVGALSFAGGLVAYTFLNVPDMLIRARVFAAAFAAAETSSSSAIWNGLKDTPLPLMLLVLAIAAPGTAYVHSTHVRLILKSSWLKPPPVHAPQSVAGPTVGTTHAAMSTANTAEERAARRVRLLEEQRMAVE